MSSRPDPRRAKQPRVPKCKVRGNSPKNYHLSTKKPKKVVADRPTSRLNDPPQAALLAEEYVHNLQQQLYFLDAELRFLHDRAGIDENENGTSVDSAIRRLRRACAMHEEETNKKIEMLKMQIDEKNKQCDGLDERQAEDKLDDANSHEREVIGQLQNAFIEMASKIHMHQLEKDHYQNAAEFNEGRRESMTSALDEAKSKRKLFEDDLKKVVGRINDIREKRKDLLRKFNASIERKRNHEEEADLLAILGNEGEQPPPNLPIATIKARSAKAEKDLEAASTTREDLERQLSQVLEKNVRLKAEYNDMKAKVERATKLKEHMERQFQQKYTHVKTENVKLLEELAQIKGQRKELKRNFAANNKKFDEFLVDINRCQAEQQLLMEAIAFKSNERDRIANENELTRAEIAVLSQDVKQMRSELEEMSSLVAEAAAKRKRIETLIAINNEDPKCKMDNVPPELAQLLDSLNAVNEKLE